MNEKSLFVENHKGFDILKRGKMFAIAKGGKISTRHYHTVDSAKRNIDKPKRLHHKRFV